MKKSALFMAVFAVLGWSLLGIGCTQQRPAEVERKAEKTKAPFVQKAVPKKEQKPKPVLPKYEVLREWEIPAGGIGMNILVSQKAKKEEVLALARHLRIKNKPKGYIFIHIFDSREAWRNRDNESYPQEKYMKHFLATVTVNPRTGMDKVRWTAEGRGY